MNSLPSFVNSWRSSSKSLLTTDVPSAAHDLMPNEVGSIDELGIISTTQQLLSSTNDADVLSTQDIVIGTILAFALAFGYTYLNGQSSSSNFVSWSSQAGEIRTDDTPSMSTLYNTTSINSTVFNETNWKEMSRRENYILYNTRIRRKKEGREDAQNKNNPPSRENKLVLVALLALFLPIFSIEIFFALSRQFLCEGGLFGGNNGAGELAERLCSPFLKDS